MTRRKSMAIMAFSTSALMMLFSGCEQDPATYQEETLNFETPISNKKVSQKKKDDLDSGAEDSSNFYFRRIGAMVPWDPYPLYDYFLEPVPVEVPVNPFYSLIDYVHPFYAYADLFVGWDDDEGGAFFGNDW